MALSSPAGGATVAGVITVTGTAGDDVSVARVEVRIDAGAWAVASGTTSWSSGVDTTAYADGPHTFSARATDSSGNASTSSVAVTVSNGPGADTTPPSIAVTTPADGATVGRTITVAGTATDDTALAAVAVSLDGGAWAAATGTSTWSATLDMSGVAAGSHVLTARATDASGNAATDTSTVTVTDGELTISDPKATNEILPIGGGRLPQWATTVGVLYSEMVTRRKAVFFRDASTGATSNVDLPTDTLDGWSNVAAVMSSERDLWVLGGGGPVLLRHYRLTGTPMPTAATRVETFAFGDTDSRQGDVIALASGAVVVAWHQQGSTGPQGQFVAYRPPGGAGWAQLPALAFMPTMASDQVLVQHPGDGSVWLFSSPDAWDAIGAAHLTEDGGALRADWTDGLFITQQRYGLNGPDPEDPMLSATGDPASGTITLAYQSAERQRFFVGDRTETASRVAVARIAGDASVTFLPRAPVWAERVSTLGLVVRGGEAWVSYRPVDPTTLSFAEAFVIRHGESGWDPPIRLGALHQYTNRVTYASGLPWFSTRLDDGLIHLWIL